MAKCSIYTSSPVKAAAVLLLIIKWELFDIADAKPTMAEDLLEMGPFDALPLALDALAALRPGLRGTLAALVADTLDGIHRPISDALLVGCGYTRTEA